MVRVSLPQMARGYVRAWPTGRVPTVIGVLMDTMVLVRVVCRTSIAIPARVTRMAGVFN
jgi:hypothetical protein